MSIIEFNNLTDEAIFTRVSSPTEEFDDINTNCKQSMGTDGVVSRLTTVLTPLEAGHTALSGSIRVRRLSPVSDEYVVTQKDSATITNDSIWEFKLVGTGSSQFVQMAYRENTNSTFIFAATDAGTYPNNTDPHVIDFAFDITNRKAFIMIDGVKPSHSSEDLVGGDPQATAQIVHKLGLGSRFSASFNQGVQAVLSRMHFWSNEFRSSAQFTTHFNEQQALIGSSPACPVSAISLSRQIILLDGGARRSN